MKKQKVKKTTPKEPKPVPPASIEKDNEKLDFGGLPQRDLKKNLGCG